jgi:hypothetical protein
MLNYPLEKLVIKGTGLSPEVTFDNYTGILEIKGRSLQSDVKDFFDDILEWLREYSKKPQPETIVNLRIEYLKTSAFKIMLDAFMILKQIQNSGHKVVINWYYEEDDDDIMETGVDYSTVIDMPFNMIAV